MWITLRHWPVLSINVTSPLKIKVRGKANMVIMSIQFTVLRHNLSRFYTHMWLVQLWEDWAELMWEESDVSSSCKTMKWEGQKDKLSLLHLSKTCWKVLVFFNKWEGECDSLEGSCNSCCHTGWLCSEGRWNYPGEGKPGHWNEHGGTCHSQPLTLF